MKHNEYTKQANDFCKKYGVKIVISYKDTECSNMMKNHYNNLYRVRIDRDHKTFSYDFHDSVNNYMNGERPTKYDVLACLTKWEPESNVWDFAIEYGYTIDSKEEYQKVEKICKAVNKEYKNVMRLFSDCMEELVEIW